MTEQTRAKAGRRSRRSASQLFIAALVMFGIAASVLLLFSENIQWLRVGLVSALWAAIVGAFAMTKYRRESVADQTKAKDLQTVYELQLAREISARREYELGVEARVRSEVQVETSEIAALRAELAHLRNNLQMLFDGNLPTERVALRAEATRMAELGGSRNYDSYQPAPSGLYVPGRPNAAGSHDAEVPDGADAGQVGSVPGLATPYDEPVTAETSVVYPDTSNGRAPTRDYYSESTRVTPSRRPEPRVPGGGRPTPTPPRVSGPVRRPTTPADSDAADYGSAVENVGEVQGPESSTATSWDDYATESDSPPAFEQADAAETADYPRDAGDAVLSQPSDDFAPAPAPAPAQTPDPTPAPTQTPDPEPASANESTSGQWDLPEPAPRRRRRADPDAAASSGAHSNGRSVAEILAGLQTGENEPTERRHRRRAD
ncbi:DUF6779 domain-containing protein [Rhodococcus sovatensis]|uniref:DUF6779 domain-containing protein n=1 Tax=Rhodococcus sovatensis TaxID=1805840 RepID=A0ABZ2PE65_9NOCA